MTTKIYDKFKKFIKENYKELVTYLIVFIILTFRLPYYIYIGGGIIDLDKRIDIKGNESGSYNMAYVKEIHATIPTYLLSFIIPSWDLESINENKIDENEDIKSIELRDKLYLEEANNNAIINAYKLSNSNITIKESSYKVIYISPKANTDIKVGDKLISVNGVSINSNTEYKKYLKTLNIGDELKVVVIRDGKEINCQARLIELNGEKIIGLYLVNLVNFEVDPKVKLNFKWNESGPSGGFMLSLALFDKLVDDDLTKGRKIVGTGTIDINGNIGEIGGIKYKLMGAVKNKANIFFVPTDNYEEAMKVKKQFNYKINIIKVDTLEDAVNYLKNN
ncbi:MAG: PDZ domain-containing protein [Bacilli bacterium]|nr:PDZ domain-containing protein [Bacilli bacterium]